MCGITGYIYLNNNRIDSVGTIKNMLSSQNHRGPDDSGIHAFNLGERTGKAIEDDTDFTDTRFTGVLGFNRLSIRDLSINGHQPMTADEGKVIIVFNGEIYNAIDYKEELVNDGVIFKSHTDTEILLHLYLKYGFHEMMKMLNGMFAIVIVDLREGVVFFGRDRFGIKPLYVYEKDGLLAFSSEIKSFYNLEGFKPELNHEMLSEYLLFRNNINNTLFKNIINLSQGHFMQLDALGNQETTKYFDVNNYNRESLIKENNKAEETITQVLVKAVNSQLVSDVKLGCQLSGGIDSSIITYEANRINGSKSMESVSVIFENKKYSEEKYIDVVSEKTGVFAHKLVLEDVYYLDNILDATWHLDAPINHPNTIGIYLLSEQAKKHVTVLLSGEGADEVFGGYDRFLWGSTLFKNRRILFELKVTDKPLELLKVIIGKPERIILSSAFMHLDIAKALYPGFNIKKALGNRMKIFTELTGSTFDKQIKYEIKTYIPDLLMRQDKMSMAHSIENRVPFLDNDIVEWAFSQPEIDFKGKNPKTKEKDNKFQLKQYCASIFGDDFSFRPKMGFGIPLKEFMDSKAYQELFNEIIMPGVKKDGIFNYELIYFWGQNVNSISSREIESLWITSAFQIWKYRFNVN